ncbi:hypothetical protein [Streptomyces sp. NBC_00467]|uniref:hypothetical protein n=1 Tax=Streptomyces sp. NBC_00467 TaxID=2975752 RepID=UPI002E19C06F
MTRYEYARACGDVLAVRTQLADQVVEALRSAGLRAFRDGEPGSPDRPRAVVCVEPDAEMGSAYVSVDWQCDADLVQAAVDALAAGDPDAPAVGRPGAAALRMQGALIKVLLSAGIIATPENDTMNPDRVLVFGRMSDLPAALRPAFVSPGSPGRPSGSG